jgi:hypothetical protein
MNRYEKLDGWPFEKVPLEEVDKTRAFEESTYTDNGRDAI